MGDEKGERYEEGSEDIQLLDGFLEGAREGSTCLPRKLPQDKPRGGNAEGQKNEGAGIGAEVEAIKEHFRPGHSAHFCPSSSLHPILPSMKPKQLPSDRILWSLVSLNGKAEWTELRIRTKLRAAELDAVLSELVKDGQVSVIPKGTEAPNQAVILLRSNWQGS